MQDFKPMCMATVLPTMPHRDPVEASRIMLENFPEAPCVPRLTRSARMYMDGMPYLVIDVKKRSLTYDLSREEELQQFYEKYLSQDLEFFAISPKYAAGFYTLIEMLKESHPSELKLIHTQMPGIVTWGLSLTDIQTGIPAWYNETMRDVLAKTLIIKAKWQVKKIKGVFPKIETMVTLGEPSLNIVSSPFGSITGEDVINTFNEIFNNIESLSCIHCCSNIDWQMLMKSIIQVINFDAYQFSDKIALYSKEVQKFLDRGGMLAWGIVPVSEESILSENEDSLFERLEKAMKLLIKGGVDKQILLEKSFITPSCVPSTLSKELAERVFHYTKNLSQTMRRKYFTDS